MAVCINVGAYGSQRHSRFSEVVGSCELLVCGVGSHPASSEEQSVYLISQPHL